MRRSSKLIAVMLIVGGVLGVGVSAMFLPAITRFDVLAALIWIFFMVLYGVAVWAGVLLWRGEHRGYVWSKRMLVLQIPVFILPSLAFKFVVGAELTVLLGSSFYIGFQLGSDWHLFVGRMSNVFVGVNLVPLLALWALRREEERMLRVVPPDGHAQTTDSVTPN